MLGESSDTSYVGQHRTSPRLWRLFVVLAICGLMTGPVAADDLPDYWEAARIQWNAVGDKAAAGDKPAFARLEAAVNACKLDAVCAGDPTSKRPSPAQIDAASAAVNLGWLYEKGKLGEPDLERAMHFFGLAQHMGQPIGIHNIAALFESGKFGIKDPRHINALYELSAASGVTASAIALGKIYRKEEYYGDSAASYVRALQTKPTQEQRDLAMEKLAALGVSPDIIAAAVASGSRSHRYFSSGRSTNALAPQSPKPVQAPAPTTPPVEPLDQARLDQARDCIARGNEISRMKSAVRSATRKLEKQDAQLLKEKRILEIDRLTINTEIDERAYNNNRARFNDRVAALDAIADRITQGNHSVDRKVDEYNGRCIKVYLTEQENDVVCANNSANIFCEGYTYD